MERILITGVGGGVGQSIIKALHETKYELVGVDSEPLGAGLYAVPSAHLGRNAVEPDFVDRLLEICQDEKCSLMFPGHDVELLFLAAHAERFTNAGTIPIVSSPEIVRLCDDKLATNAYLRSHGFSVPETGLLREIDRFKLPLVLKPQLGGARSRNTYVVRSTAELDVFTRLVDADNCLVQEYIDGDEYTCGAVGLEGRCVGVIAMRRSLRAGDTYKAFVERNARVEGVVHDVVELLKPFGACNVQLRLRDGEPVIFEINARCSGTTAARALAGFNEPKMIADHVLHGVAPAFSIKEIAILRYWNELVVANDRIEELKTTGHIRGPHTRL